MKTSNFKITTKKLNAGHFKVTIFDNVKWEEKGSFETTDMTLVDDIQNLNNGDEQELISYESFEDVIETCISKLD